MNRQRLLLLVLLVILFVGVSTLFFTRVWQESRTRFRTGLPIPEDILPEELRQSADIIPSGPPTMPEIRESDPRLFGDKTSPVTIMLFGDFQCEFCRDQAFALEQALRNTGHPNKFQIIWRDLPIVTKHSQAMSAATVGRCAHAQNRFKGMHDLLFSRAEAFSDTEFLAFARQLNLNEQAFLTCLRDPAIPFQIQRDIELAREHAIVEVPIMFIEGKALTGFVDAETLELVLKRELENAEPSS